MLLLQSINHSSLSLHHFPWSIFQRSICVTTISDLSEHSVFIHRRLQYRLNASFRLIHFLTPQEQGSTLLHIDRLPQTLPLLVNILVPSD
jgi:hypothetical protein